MVLSSVPGDHIQMSVSAKVKDSDWGINLVHVCVYRCVYVFMCAWVSSCMWGYAGLCMYMYMSECGYMCMRVRTHRPLWVWMYM